MYHLYLAGKANSMSEISLTVVLLFATYCLCAQNSAQNAERVGKIPGLETENGQIDYLTRFYFQNVNNTYELVNGKEYIPYYFNSSQKPLLFFGRKHKSSLVVNGRRYQDVFLEYDTHLDELIYSDNMKLIDSKVFTIALNKDPVDGFSFYYSDDTLVLRHLSPERDPEFNLPEGFYEVVYDGRSKYIISHRSHLNVEEGMDQYVYEPEKYIQLKGKYIRVKNTRGFLELFEDRTAEMKKFLRSNRIHFRKSDKKAIAAALQYYDKLNLSVR